LTEFSQACLLFFFLESPINMPASSKTPLLEVERLMAELVGSSDLTKAVSATERAAHYHLATGGQRMRARLAMEACRALRVEVTDAVRLAAGVELLHNASLVHDDLHDLETVRRGQPTVWCTFGQDVAICAGDLLLSGAYGALAGFSDSSTLPALLRRVHDRTTNVIHGQSTELATKDTIVDEVALYEQIVVGKSGALLSLPLELALIAAHQTQWCSAAREAAHAFGLGYQMVDDLEDLADDTQKQRLNIVNVVRAAGATGEAGATVRGLAQAHLERASTLAHGLPIGTGDLLAELALALGQRLRKTAPTA
jgi:geranylgeranyl pyrophosphate synthase